MAGFVNLYEPRNEVEVCVLKSILDAEEIIYFVCNDLFGSIKPGPPIKGYNTKMFLVDARQHDRAKKIVAGYLEKTGASPIQAPSSYSRTDKFRMILEGLLLGWFIPGSRSSRS